MRQILLVHANSDDGGMYAEYLRAQGLSVMEVASTDAAVPLLPTADAVVTGLMVPGTFDGIELITRIRAEWPTKPVVVVTACTVPGVRESAASAGCDLLLTKPCLPDELCRALQRKLAAAPER